MTVAPGGPFRPYPLLHHSLGLNFCERPGSIWAMVSEAAARNPDGEALVCGATLQPICDWLLRMEAWRYAPHAHALQLATLQREFRQLPWPQRIP